MLVVATCALFGVETLGCGSSGAESEGGDERESPSSQSEDGLSNGSGDSGDADRDGDLLSNDREEELGTDPDKADTDGDGASDFIEVDVLKTDPNDASEGFLETEFALRLPHRGEEQVRTERFETRINNADVLFLVDATPSMFEECARLLESFGGTIIPGIQNEIPGLHIGAAVLGDYPSSPSAADDVPFYLLREIAPVDEDIGAWSTDARRCSAVGQFGKLTGAANGRPDILEAMEGIPCLLGGDIPESYPQALWAVATGNALSWPNGQTPPAACTADAENPSPRGYPCFRSGALPVVVMFGDAPFHHGPGGTLPYSDVPGAPTYEMAIAELRALKARVVGVHSGSFNAAADFRRAAIDTKAVDLAGTPLVSAIKFDGTGISTATVDVVRNVVRGTPLDIATRVENVAGNPEDFDATQFVKSVRAREGYRDGNAGEGYTSSDERSFYGTIPGSEVEFDFAFRNDVQAPAAEPAVFKVQITVTGDGIVDLDERSAYIVVPPE